MANHAARWTLEQLVDFEQVATSSAGTSQEIRSSVTTAIRGLEGADARRTGLHVWLNARGGNSAGRKFSSALSIVGCGLAVFAFVAGISGVLGLLESKRGGMNVTLFFAVLIGAQWLILLLSCGAWLLRRKAADGFSGLQALIGKLARMLAGKRDDGWWHGIMESGGAARAAVLWRLARLTQTAGISFNLGIVCGLLGLVMVRHIGFFWESTTELAMREVLLDGVKFLSVPWARWMPSAVPGPAIIDASRWIPGRLAGLAPGPAAWWEFLVMVTAVWGMLPRMILWIVAFRAGNRALAALDFQARHHRSLWREITGNSRVESDEKPLDGVLVLDVGGCGLTEKSLRPFLLRRLRVHPTAWHPVAVLDPGGEHDATAALAKAPAGVILLAEGWALAPARMLALHAKVRASSGPETPMKFLVVNVDADSQPIPATAKEKIQWSQFVDSLRDPAAEVFFFEAPQDGL